MDDDWKVWVENTRSTKRKTAKEEKEEFADFLELYNEAKKSTNITRVFLEKVHKHYKGQIESMTKRKEEDDEYVEVLKIHNANEIEKLHKHYKGMIGKMEKRMKAMEEAYRAMVNAMDEAMEMGDREGDESPC